MAVEFVAPNRVYQIPRASASERTEANGYSLGVPLGLAKTKTGGLATWFQGHPFPRKTFIYAGVTEPNNKAKRITLALFLPFASLRNGIKAFLNSYLHNYTRLVDSFYADCDQIPYLYYQYYSEFGKSLWDFIYFFLKRLGIKDQVAYRTGLQIATMIENDDAYRVRLQDLLNEANKEALLKNPRKELLRLLEIYKQREPTLSDEKDLNHAGARIIGMAKMISLLLYIPWVKNAFKFALNNVNFEWFKLDEWDHYWTLNRIDYNCNGKTFEERKEEMLEIMVNFAKQLNPNKEVVKVETPDGVNINII